VLYVGLTNNLERRLHEHITGKFKGFTSRYNCHHLIYFEEFDNVSSAISREKYIKDWSRKKKHSLINSVNPEWQFLNDGSRITKGPSSRPN
jgi:putative endonuclease